MNPLVPVLADKLLAQKQNTSLNQYDLQLAIEKEQRKTNTRRVTGIVVGGIVLFFAGRKIYKEYKKNKAGAEQDVYAQSAKLFQIAMEGMGTDEKLIFDTARKIQSQKLDYKKVSNIYKDITGRSLDSDFQSDLDTKEYADLMTILSETYNPDTDDKNESNVFFKAIRKTGIYRTPDSISAIASIDGAVPVSGYLTNVEKIGISYISPLLSKKYMEFVSYGNNQKYWVAKDDIERQSKAQHDKFKSETGGKMYIIKK